jgi:hypothetical protein
MRSYKDDPNGIKKAIAFRDTNPFVDLVMHFTMYSPFVIAGTGVEPVCCTDYLEVSEYEVYQKLNDLTAAAISDSFEKSEELNKAVAIRQELRKAWSGSNGDVSELIKGGIVNICSKTSALESGQVKAALENLVDAKDCCQNLYVFGEDGGVEKGRCITAEEICAFIGK